jgi:hypothetical protein
MNKTRNKTIPASIAASEIFISKMQKSSRAKAKQFASNYLRIINMTLTFIIVAAIAMNSQIALAANYQMWDNKLLQMQISELGPTRLSMQDERIVDIFIYPEDAAKIVLHQSGSVFIVPNSDHKHVYLTVVGEAGSTQDLRMRFVFKQPVPILLTPMKHLANQSDVPIYVKEAKRAKHKKQ